MTHRNIISLAAAAWLTNASAGCASDMNLETDARRASVAAQEAANDKAQKLWQVRRAQAIEDAEAQARVLARARASVQSRQKLGIPREAAICFEARNIMQADLDAAMRSGGEFGQELDNWHAQSKGVEMYCTYALTVGAPK